MRKERKETNGPNLAEFTLIYIDEIPICLRHGKRFSGVYDLEKFSANPY